MYVLIPVFLAADARPSLVVVVGVQESDAPSGSTNSWLEEVETRRNDEGVSPRAVDTRNVPRRRSHPN